jgi:hypothetical protein
VQDDSLRVAWFALEDLGTLLCRRADDSVKKATARVVRPELVAVDDIVCSPWPTTHPRASTGSPTPPTRNGFVAISSNLHPGAFDEPFRSLRGPWAEPFGLSTSR